VVLFIAIGVSLAVAAAALVAYIFLHEMEKHAVLAAKVRDFSGVATAGMEEPSGQASGLFVRITTSLGNLVKPQNKEELSLLQKKFLKAGLRSRSALVTFFGAKAFCAFCLSVGFVAALVILRLHIAVLNAMMLTIGLAMAGFYAPNVWLSLKASRRQQSFLRSFPDTLDLLVVCAEAGMGLDAALKRVGDEMRLSSKVLSDEFQLLNLEMRAGKDRRDAMKSLADRIGLDEVSSWVTLLIQTDRFGTGIAQALRVHSDSMRAKRALRVEELAAKLPVKLLFPTIFCIFPSLFLVLMGPAMVRIWRMWTGA
jgi:tight adherence protein C